MEPRVLIFSLRYVDLRMYNCWMYEFEDAICQIDTVHLHAPRLNAARNFPRFARRCALTFGRGLGLSHKFFTPLAQTKLDRCYDLFFTAFQFASQIPHVDSITNWQTHCRVKVCYLGEFWPHELDNPRTRQQLELLNEFDAVFSHCSWTPLLERVVKRPCYQLSLGVDATRFCPLPWKPARTIDVYSMGRRPPAIHASLVSLSREAKIHYLYNTSESFDVIDPAEHREALADTIKRSKLFVAYNHRSIPGHVAGAQDEVGSRFFEGVAGGSVLIGAAPECDTYRKHFDWVDAVIQAPQDASRIGEFLASLQEQGERLSNARRANVTNTLLRHDWLFRWEEVLKVLNFPTSSRSLERKNSLGELAKDAADLFS